MKHKPNAQFNVAAPDSLAVRVATVVRKRMFAQFMGEFAPGPQETILDIGVTSDQSYSSSNYFEALYPFPACITAAGLDDAKFLEQQYPGLRFVEADATDLPFADGAFDLVHTSAVLEHVGTEARQRQMIGECLRVARRGVCITTPNRWFPVEFHTQLPLLHWLPARWYRALYRLSGYGFFAEEANLNLLSARDLNGLSSSFGGWRFRLHREKLGGLTSNLILFAHRN